MAKVAAPAGRLAGTSIRSLPRTRTNLNWIKGSWPTVGLAAVIAMALVPTAGSGAQPGKGPVKVFILAGQSNMEGHGAVKISQKTVNDGKGTLEYLVKDPATAERAASAGAGRRMNGAWAS